MVDPHLACGRRGKPHVHFIEALHGKWNREIDWDRGHADQGQLDYLDFDRGGIRFSRVLEPLNDCRGLPRVVRVDRPTLQGDDTVKGIGSRAEEIGRERSVDEIQPGGIHGHPVVVTRGHIVCARGTTRRNADEGRDHERSFGAPPCPSYAATTMVALVLTYRHRPRTMKTATVRLCLDHDVPPYCLWSRRRRNRQAGAQPTPEWTDIFDRNKTRSVSPMLLRGAGVAQPAGLTGDAKVRHAISTPPPPDKRDEGNRRHTRDYFNRCPPSRQPGSPLWMWNLGTPRVQCQSGAPARSRGHARNSLWLKELCEPLGAWHRTSRQCRNPGKLPS
jgi:hypothetical protein